MASITPSRHSLLSGWAQIGFMGSIGIAYALGSFPICLGMISATAAIWSSIRISQTCRRPARRRIECSPNSGPGLFTRTDEPSTVEKKLISFLRDLRAKNLLLTQAEFEQRYSQVDFKVKEEPIGRIIGRDFIENNAKKLNWDRIKVPKKIMVLDPGAESLSITIDGERLIPFAEGCRCYTQIIKPVKRPLTREEVLQMADMLETTGYYDYDDDNFFIVDKGVCFTDTELASFSSFPCFYPPAFFDKKVAEKDCEWARAELASRMRPVKKETPISRNSIALQIPFASIL